jgi:hypothetical protein
MANIKNKNDTETKTIQYIIFEKHHILIFILTIWTLLYLSEFSFLKKYSINIYQVAAFSMAYQYINTNMTVYSILGSAFIASFTAYFIYLFLHKYTRLIVLNAIITFCVIILTDFANCFTIGALIYAMIAVKEIPQLKSGYLFSFFIACLTIVCFYFLFTKIISFIQNKFHFFEDYQLLEKKWY